MNALTQLFQRVFCGDRYMLAAIFLLMVVSILSVYSSASVLAYQRMGGDTAHVLMRHCLLLVLSVSIMCFVSHLKPGVWSGLAWPLLILAVVLQAATLLAGTSINGASRWLSVGGIQFQPSEISKIALMVFVARQLSTNEGNLPKAFWRILVATMAIGALILLENLSTCLLLVASVWIVMAVARVPFLYLGGTAAVVAGVVGVMIYFAPQLAEMNGSFERALTWRARVERFVTDDADERNAGNYQAEQAKAAVSTGGLIGGRGPGNSYMKNFLPMAFSDFIFSIIIEEYGVFPGCVLVLAFYFTILARAESVAKRCVVPFRTYLIFGLALMLTLQALINMSVGVGLIPVTGQTLPMVSMGGTSNFAMGLAFGMMLSISSKVDSPANIGFVKSETA